MELVYFGICELGQLIVHEYVIDIVINNKWLTTPLVT